MIRPNMVFLVQLAACCISLLVFVIWFTVWNSKQYERYLKKDNEKRVSNTNGD